MEQNKKQGNGLVWFIVLILVALCGYFAYELYMKPESKEENKTEEKTSKKEEKEIEELNIDNPIVKELTELISINSTYGRDYYDKLTINTEVNAKSLDNQFKLYLAYLQVPVGAIKTEICSKMNLTLETGYVCGSGENNDVTKVIEESEMKSAVEKIFGDESYLAETFNPNYWLVAEKYYYDNVHKNYVLAYTEGGGTGFVNDLTVKNAVKDGNSVIISVEHIAVNDDNENETLNFDFNFKKENDHYIFHSVKRTK